MKTILNWFTILAILTLTVSCTEKECGFGKISGLRGEWEWIQSSGGLAGVTITPETVMATQSLRIDETHYEEYRNDSLMFRTTYEIVISPDTVWGSNTFIEFETGGSMAFIQEGSTLTFFELCFDCFVHVYERK